jgi:hypothetical protein
MTGCAAGSCARGHTHVPHTWRANLAQAPAESAAQPGDVLGFQ